MSTAPRETVLIIEDDTGIASLEQRTLERAGYRVLLSETTQSAVDTLRQHRIDLIVLDYRLPGGIDGLQFYNELRQAGFEVPVILVTAFSSEATVIKALRAGVRDFVSKTVEFLDYLPDAVEHVLRQVRTEQQLAESEARLATIIQTARDAILIAGAEQRITLFNRAAEEMFGTAANEALGQPVARFIPKEFVGPDGRPATDASLSHLSRWGNHGVRANGEIFPIEAAVSRTDIGDQRFYTVVIRDITERERTAQRLREQAALIDMASDAILVEDVQGVVQFWNKGAERLYGWNRAEAVGHSTTELIDRGHMSEREVALQSVLKEGTWTGELPRKAKDGTKLIVQSRWTLVENHLSPSPRVLVFDTDITERKQLEAQLVHAQKMETVGRLAGGIAHDFNNLLTGILGYAQLLQLENNLAPEHRAEIAEIEKLGKRAADLTRQLLAFSRKQKLQTVLLNLNQLIDDATKMLQRLIGEDVELLFVPCPRQATVYADPSQIEQVLMNLVINARDAMPKGGKITIETDVVTLNEDYVRVHAETIIGDYVMLSVSDDGHGMDAATLDRVFEPFFTTKEVGKGTGLGLATVFGIVKQHGGHINAYSEPGFGTTFKVYLPFVEDMTASRSTKAAPALGPTGRETILLVEDEPAVRAVTERILANHGYTVLAVDNPTDAIEQFERRRDEIDLLVTDVVMPLLSGRDLYEVLRERKPSLRVLYMSGYTDDAIVHRGVLDASAAFLSKPFSWRELAEKVRSVLET